MATDLHEVLDLKLLLPVGGKTYRVDPPPAAVTLQLIEMFQRGILLGAMADAGLGAEELAAVHDTLTIDMDVDSDFARDCLGRWLPTGRDEAMEWHPGHTLDELTADNQPTQVIEFVLQTALIAWATSKDAAMKWWESGGKAPAPILAGLPMATPTLRAEAYSTPTRVSRNGTKRRKRAKARRSR